MKKEIFILILIAIGMIIGAGGMYLFFGEKKQTVNTHTEQHFQDSTAQAPRDSNVIIPKKKNSKSQFNLDSLKSYFLNVGFLKGMDSLASYILWVESPVDTSIQFDTVARVDVQYNPIDHNLGVGLLLSPIKKDSVVVTDTARIYIERQKTLSDYALEISGIFIFYQLIKFLSSLF